jgi:UDP-N-acetylmuramoyl-tripeptide--D-alanyl-D-alanine ligase
VVVTPGLVELGSLQSEENTGFAGAMAGVATDLVIVGRTNRRALLRGARRPGIGAPRVVVVSTRPKATEWVREHLESGDIVLYENDLPDHYP